MRALEHFSNQMSCKHRDQQAGDKSFEGAKRMCGFSPWCAGGIASDIGDIQKQGAQKNIGNRRKKKIFQSTEQWRDGVTVRPYAQTSSDAKKPSSQLTECAARKAEYSALNPK